LFEHETRDFHGASLVGEKPQDVLTKNGFGSRGKTERSEQLVLEPAHKKTLGISEGPESHNEPNLLGSPKNTNHLS